MTRDLIRLDPSSLHLAYVVFKDPQIRLDKTRPVFPHCGNILIGVESVSFFQDLRELVSHEAPQWADDIDLVTTVALSPAAKVRLRKELQFTNRIIRAHLRMPEDPFEPNDKLIAETALSLSRLADTLRQEVVVGTQDEEEQKFIQQRHALIVLNCWSIVRDIALIELRRRLYSVPHALSSLLSSARVWMDGCLSAVTDIRGSKQAMNALHLVFEFLHAGDPVQKANGAYLLQDRVQRFQFFIDRAVTEIGTNDYLLSRDDRAFFESAAREVQAYAASRESKTRDSAVADQSTPESPGTAVASGPLQGVQAEMPLEEADWTKRFSLSEGLVIDPPARTVILNGKSCSVGKSLDRFKLLMILARNRNRWVPAERFTQADGPWHEKGVPSPGTLRTAISRLRTQLAPLPELANALENESHQLHGTARLLWPPPAQQE